MKTSRTTDPVVRAAELLYLAENAFFALPIRGVCDEFASEVVAAEARWEAAEEAFADTVPTSARGAVIKLVALIDLCQASGVGEDSLEVRHLRALLTYMDALNGERVDGEAGDTVACP
jgi:hypothetical protein